MAHRKSIMHPRLEELGARSPTASPLRRRSSVMNVPPEPETATENDDETERLQRRQEKNRRSVDADKRRSLGLSFISSMSNPQITDGVTQCIKLCAENKINVKNAFSLKMIDFMTYMVKKSNVSMDNLQMASTSLDVSTKIYGFRVDGVHHDILKMSGGLQREEKRDERRSLGATDENGEAPAEAEVASTQRPKKKRSRAKIFATHESLKGTIQTIDPMSLTGVADHQTTDMLYQAVLPVHANSDLSLHPYQDVILDTANPVNEAEINRAPVNCPKIERFDHLDICPSFANFEYLGWTPDDEETSSPSKEKTPTPEADDGFRFDIDASLPMDDEADHGRHSMSDYFDADEDENAEACHRVGPPPVNIVDFREAVMNAGTNQNFEYSYVNERINIRNAGPSHWKIRFPSKNLGRSRVVEGCGQQPVKRRKDVPLVFDEETSRVCMARCDVIKDKGTRLSEKTTRTRWSEERLILSRDVEYDNMKYCKYYLRPDVIKNFPSRGHSNAVELPDELGDYNYNNANDTLEYCPGVDNDDDHPDSNNDNTINGIATEEEFPPTRQAFTGENLIEAPKMTNKILIAFSQRAKKVDMRALKRAIWKDLTVKNNNDKENNDENEATEANKTEEIQGTKQFSDTYKNLPKLLTKSNAEATSVPIAFISLLHLANEKNLEITSTEDFSDLNIRQG